MLKKEVRRHGHPYSFRSECPPSHVFRGGLCSCPARPATGGAPPGWNTTAIRWIWSPWGGDYLPRQSFTYSGPYRYGPDPEQAYAGDPASSSGGWYCFEGPIIEAANAWLQDQGSELRAESETGADLDRLEQLLRQGTPVAVWFTQDYEQPRFNTSFTWTLPDGSTYTPYGNLHCVVLTGMAETQCYLADPMQGDSVIERDRFERIYTAMGSRAVVLR